DRDYTQRPPMLLSQRARDLSAKTRDRPAATRDTTSAASPVANSRSRWEYPRTTANGTTIIASGMCDDRDRVANRGRRKRPHRRCGRTAKTQAPDVASNEPPAGGEDLRPAQNANGVPQSGRPKWIRLRERVDHGGAIGFNDPQPAGGIA